MLSCFKAGAVCKFNIVVLIRAFVVPASKKAFLLTAKLQAGTYFLLDFDRNKVA